MKVGALHFCSGSGNGIVSMVLPVILAMCPRHYRHRVKIHSGTDKEIIASLASYGIKRDNVTPRLGGDFDDDKFRAWLEVQRQREQEVGRLELN